MKMHITGFHLVTFLTSFDLVSRARARACVCVCARQVEVREEKKLIGRLLTLSSIHINICKIADTHLETRRQQRNNNVIYI